VPFRLTPGDAVTVFGGREAWQAANRHALRGARLTRGLPPRLISCSAVLPGFHGRALLVWVLLDEAPVRYDIAWGVHSAIFAYGMPLLDNALRNHSAKACAEEGRDEFMLMVARPGGRRTSSPANPIAVNLIGRRAAPRGATGRMDRPRTGSTALEGPVRRCPPGGASQ
jgi:hypothetical protein